MSKFIDREEEYAFLGAEYEKTESSLVILYGRRRIGKTALITEFGKDKNALYFLATEESESENRNTFQQMVADYTGNALLKNASVDNWGLIFDALLNYQTPGKKLIIIDEFQYIGRSNPAFPSIVQKIWDTQLKDAGIMLILCGSLISLMESQTLKYGSPLYGRRTGQIKLKQIPFRHYHEFFPDKTNQELIEFYSITGGVPKYIELFSDNHDIYSAIRKNVLSKQSFLYEEPTFLLQNEVSEIGSYFSIIKTIAAGNQKLGNIASALSLAPTGMTKYLKTLIDLDILEREVPITEENPEKSKKGLYKIKDNFIEFWFRFIYPNKSFIETGNTDYVMKKIKDSLVGSHISYVYEDICIERMWQLSAEGAFPATFDRIGRWWGGKDVEIDIVAYDSVGKSDIVFGECKYTGKPMDTDIFYALQEKKKAVEWQKGKRNEWFVFFCINGFTDEMKALAESRKNVFLFD